MHESTFPTLPRDCAPALAWCCKEPAVRKSCAQFAYFASTQQRSSNKSFQDFCLLHKSSTSQVQRKTAVATPVESYFRPCGHQLSMQLLPRPQRPKIGFVCYALPRHIPNGRLKEPKVILNATNKNKPTTTLAKFNGWNYTIWIHMTISWCPKAQGHAISCIGMQRPALASTRTELPEVVDALVCCQCVAWAEQKTVHPQPPGTNLWALLLKSTHGFLTSHTCINFCKPTHTRWIEEIKLWSKTDLKPGSLETWICFDLSVLIFTSGYLGYLI